MTGCHRSDPTEAEYSAKLVHPDANARPCPAHDADSANTRSPTAPRSITRPGSALSGRHVAPPLWVAYSAGPYAQPSRTLRNLIWLTPDDPFGASVAGAAMADQLLP
jgi:hypothetical protein